jgi:hypothetical protein
MRTRIQFILSGILLLVILSCTKDETPAPAPEVCDVKGIYTGIGTDRFNTLITMTYEFMENNYVAASGTLTDDDNAFGGYRNTCDSVVWNAHNNINNHKYLYKAALSDNRTKLKGTYQDLDNPVDIGTLDLTKQ